MKKLTIYIILFTSLLSSNIHSQEKVDLQTMQRIREEEKNNSQITMLAHNLTDVVGPRLTNSPGYNRALEWLTKLCTEWQFAHVGPEAWGEFGKGWQNNKTQLSIKSPYYENMIAYAAPWSKSMSKSTTTQLVMIDKLDSASIDKAGDLKGKIVLVKPAISNLEIPLQPDAKRYDSSVLDTLPDCYMVSQSDIDKYLPFYVKLYYATLYLEKKGAIAMISSRGNSVDGTAFVDGGTGYKKGYEATLPEFKITLEDRLKLARLLQDNKKVEVEADIQNTFYDKDLTGYNFIAELPGTDPKLKDQVVMLGGHLDSWAAATGATDNAAGCIVAMEAMRILKSLGVTPRRTIRLALWGGEEQGLYGSIGYVKKHFGDPKDMKLKPEQAKISAYYNLDNGSGKIRGIYLQHNDSLHDIFKSWLAPFSDMDATGVTRSNTGSTDHLSFDAVGIPAFQFIQDELDYETRTHHSNMDTYDHLSIDDLKQAAVIMAAFIYNTAMRDEMLTRKPLPTPEKFIFDIDFPL